jgi:hypothetical protein
MMRFMSQKYDFPLSLLKNNMKLAGIGQRSWVRSPFVIPATAGTAKPSLKAIHISFVVKGFQPSPE